MALISCVECGGTVSTKANACPHCGYSTDHTSIGGIAESQTVATPTIAQDHPSPPPQTPSQLGHSASPEPVLNKPTENCTPYSTNSGDCTVDSELINPPSEAVHQSVEDNIPSSKKGNLGIGLRKKQSAQKQPKSTNTGLIFGFICSAIVCFLHDCLYPGEHWMDYVPGGESRRKSREAYEENEMRKNNFKNDRETQLRTSYENMKKNAELQKKWAAEHVIKK